MIELNNETFTKDILDGVTFFQIAEGGAMGEGGGIVFVTEDGAVYHANYVYGDLKPENMEMAFPIIKDCHFGLFGIGSVVPEGWNYVNLGCGNHLIVRKDRYDDFAKRIADYNYPPEIYRIWLEQALATEKNQR